jgi:flagellar biosynthesis/type III secretory pathway chaperone
MEKLLEKLLEVLEQQFVCCTQLLNLSQTESTALKDNDIQGLFAVCKEITVLSQQLAQLEEVRTEVHCQAVCSLGLAEETSLKELLAVIIGQDENLADRLEEQAVNLNSTYSALQQQNELNQLLLRQAAAYANMIVSALRPDYRLTYGRCGGIYQNRLNSPFVNRTV